MPSARRKAPRATAPMVTLGAGTLGAGTLGAGTLGAGTLVAGAAALVALAAPVGLASAAAHQPTSVGVTLAGGCRGQVTSHQPKGKVLDTASGPEAPGATSADPLHVARGGTISWSGSTPVAFSDHTWWVHIDGFPALSGSSSNGSHATSASGILRIGSYLPSWLGLTGLYYVSGQISGAGGACTGAVYVSLTGDPATGLAMWAGIVFVLFGLALLAGARPSWLARFRVVPTGSVIATRPPRRPATTMPTGSVVKTRPSPDPATTAPTGSVAETRAQLDGPATRPPPALGGADAAPPAAEGGTGS